MAGKNKINLSVDAVQHCFENKKSGRRVYSREINIYFSNGYSLSKTIASDSSERCDAHVKDLLRELRRQIDEELEYLSE